MDHNILLGGLLGIELAILGSVYHSESFTKYQKYGIFALIIFMPAQIVLILILWLYNKNQDKIPKLPTSLSKKLKKTPDQLNPKLYREVAQHYYNEKEYKKAISAINYAIQLDPNKSQDFFYLACYYSILNDKPKAFESLAKAVKLGYKDYPEILSNPDLKYLRDQSEYEKFALNGYSFD